MHKINKVSYRTQCKSIKYNTITVKCMHLQIKFRFKIKIDILLMHEIISTIKCLLI